MRLLHPALAFGIGAGSDVGNRRVSTDAQRIIEIATAKVIERSTNLAARRGVENISGRIGIEFIAVVDHGGLDKVRYRPRQSQEILLGQSKLGRFVMQEAPDLSS